MENTNPSDLTLIEDEFDLSDELRLYFQNKFRSKETKNIASFTDEPYISSWEGYCAEAKKIGALEVLKTCYPQLNFPIENDINKTPTYADAVLRGKFDVVNLENNLQINAPEGITIKVHESIAGKVPVLKVADSQDFIKIIQCVLHKNNPTFVPQSMGASLVNGINNWERIHSLKKNWVANNSQGNWNQEFSTNILPNPSLYKDKIVILSTKPYSNVPAESLGLAADVWANYSFSIRLEHEFTHLYTLKKYGYASNNLHDELIADYIGITKTVGYYNKDWMLAFMGLGEYPKYRKGARLENYIGIIDTSSEEFTQLTTIIKNAIENIADFDTELGRIASDQDQMCRIDALCETDVLEIASENGVYLLLQKYNQLS